MTGAPVTGERAGVPGKGGTRWVVCIDGGSRGNPGPAGAGAVVYDSGGRMITGRGRPLGRATNNEAEYGGLLLGLELARDLGAKRLEIRADSELLVRQMNGEYRIRAGNLRELAERARSLLAGFVETGFVAVPRERNFRADRLANRAMDEDAEVSERGDRTAAGRNGSKERSER